MRYRALATDYDGTLAADGRVDETTIDALRRARAAGIILIMVTGRELADLFNTFAHPELFERIVAENGAVLYEPATTAVERLAPAPPPHFLQWLARASVPVSVGHSIVATVEPYEHQLLTAIRDLGLEWHVIFNKGSVMALPADVTKVTGLNAALTALGVAPIETVGVGDAENDQAFLRAVGLSVAVSNALASVKEMSDVVLLTARGAGVTDLIDRLISGELDAVQPDPSKHVAPAAGER
jgi:hydroxymethylpyrimidine pyrophosphatase-like HAD family hydrolase